MNTDFAQKFASLADDPSIYLEIVRIGSRFGLNIDQLGELDAEFCRILMGLSKPQDFSRNISKLLEVDIATSAAITTAINAEFPAILARKLSGETENQERLNQDHTISSIEKAGGFEIERPRAPLPVRKSLNLLEEEASESPDDAVEEKQDIMAGIENPEPTSMKPSVRPMSQAPESSYPRTEPLVDQLLQGSTAMPEQKVVREEPSIIRKPAAPQVPPRPAGSDPYRESIE